VSPVFVRLSIGVEDLDDILWDLHRALSRSWGRAARAYADARATVPI
jgi:hypothetical protein